MIRAGGRRLDGLPRPGETASGRPRRVASRPRKKKADVREPFGLFPHVGLLVNKPPATGLPFVVFSDTLYLYYTDWPGENKRLLLSCLPGGYWNDPGSLAESGIATITRTVNWLFTHTVNLLYGARYSDVMVI